MHRNARDAYGILVEKRVGDVLVLASSSDLVRRTFVLLCLKPLEDEEHSKSSHN